MSTPQERVADTIGRTIDGRISRLQDELASLEPATVAAKRAAIIADLAELGVEKARIDLRRSRTPVAPTTEVAAAREVRLK